MYTYILTAVRDLIRYMTRQQPRTRHQQCYLQLMHFSSITHARFVVCYSTAVTCVFYPVMSSQRMSLHASVTVSSRVNIVALMSDKVFTRDSRVTSHYTRVLHTRVRRCIKAVP